MRDLKQKYSLDSMNTNYKVAEVGLVYRNRVPKKDRIQILDSSTAYKVLKESFSDETID